jgi:formate-dependent phosphoribosylglycinamide formyltransferase (GAR transformylase)
VRRILLLAATTGYQTRAFEEASARLGVALIYATDRCDVLEDPWADGAIAIRFHDVPASVAAIVERVRMVPIDGMLVVGDRPVAVAARAAREIGLPGHSPEAADASCNKLLMRQLLRRAGLPVPNFQEAAVGRSPEALARSVPFPCVIKPLALSGSRGVMRADDESGFIEAFERLRAILDSTGVRAERNALHDRVLVESFIPGREFAVEGLMTHGALQVLAIFDKPDPLDGPFFEETIYVTPSSESSAVQERIEEAVTTAAKALGLAHGPIHAECRVSGRDVFVLEVAARPIGGLCARALMFERAGRSSSFEELLLRHAAGEPTTGWVREALASGVMMIPIPKRGILRHVSGVDSARQVAGVEDVRIAAKADQLLLPLPESASYLGFIFAKGERSDGVERALRDAHARLVFAIDPEVRVVQSTHG